MTTLPYLPVAASHVPPGLTTTSIFGGGVALAPCLQKFAIRSAETGDSMSAMGWGLIEAEPQVTGWLDSLTDDEFGQVERYIDLLAEQGVHLSEPFTRQLDGKLRELRFHLDRQQTRISYYIATGRIIVLLTVFTKTKPRERAEIDRARRAMKRCIDEGHVTASEEDL